MIRHSNGTLDDMKKCFENTENINIVDLRENPVILFTENFYAKNTQDNSMVKAYEEMRVAAKSKDNRGWSQVLIEADTISINNTYYSRKELEIAHKSPRIQRHIANKTWFGEYNHPSTPDLQGSDENTRIASIKRTFSCDPDKISHLIRDYRWEGKSIIGECAFVDRPISHFVRSAVLNEGSMFDMSIRAMAKVSKTKTINGKSVIVREGLEPWCYDMLTYPGFLAANMANGDIRERLLSNVKEAYNINGVKNVGALNLYEAITDNSYPMKELCAEAFSSILPKCRSGELVVIGEDGMGVYSDRSGTTRTVNMEHASLVMCSNTLQNLM